jgi:hypothetical protein
VPNGNPEFRLNEQEAWFAKIAKPISLFVAQHGLVLDKYYREVPSWDLRFGHPLGGSASIQIMNAGVVARICTVWHLDDYDKFTRFLHWRDPVDVELDSESIFQTLAEELRAILATPLDNWTKVATGCEESWSGFSTAQFESMGPTYPIPKSLSASNTKGAR